MVKKIKLITYGCELCNKEYKNIDEAIKCEAQGIIGPEIKPGLVVRRHPGNLYEPYPTYNIFLEEEKSIGHNRRYNTLKLYDGYILEPFFRRIIDYNQEAYRIDTLMKYFKDKTFRFPNKRQFSKLIKMFNKKNETAFLVRKLLYKKYNLALSDLYKYHPYFAELTINAG